MSQVAVLAMGGVTRPPDTRYSSSVTMCRKSFRKRYP